MTKGKYMILSRLMLGAAIFAAAIPVVAQEAGPAPLTVADQKQQPVAIDAEVLTPHAECLFFTKEGEGFRAAITNPRDPRYKAQFGLSRMTEDVAKHLGAAPASASSAAVPPIASSKNFIDQFIYKGLQDAGVQPADKTNDYEFLRRVSIDLTGRPPVADRVRSFIGDTSADKRAKLIEELEKSYDRIILDCPPGLTETSDQVLRAADVVVVPVIPSPLSHRALEEVKAHLDREHGGHGAILPVFSMVDRRRSLHRGRHDDRDEKNPDRERSSIQRRQPHRACI